MPEIEREPAANNPWYVLATIAGEQDSGDEPDHFLARDNARAWNAWVTQGLTAADVGERFGAEASKLPGIGEWAELEPKIRKQFRERTGIGRGEALPDPTDGYAFECVTFERIFDLGDFLFPATLHLSDCLFEAPAILTGCRFMDAVHLENTRFDKRAWFDRAVFEGPTDFSRTDFGGQAHFEAARFAHDVEFERTTFGAEAEFVEAEFGGDLICTAVEFPQGAYFRGAKIAGAAYFGGGKFRDGAFFAEVEIGGDAVFSEARFGAEAWFEGALVGGGFFARDARFRGIGMFDRMKVRQETQFGGAVFAEVATFQGVDFGGFVYFDQVEFDGPVNFTDCQFERPANFRQALFKLAYPSLSGAVLHSNMHFTARDFPHGADADKSLRYWPPGTEDINASRNACSILRHAVGQQGRPEDEHFFFRKEMWFAGRTHEPILVRLPYLFFGWVSDFGYSIAKPAFCLTVLWAIGFAAYWGYLIAQGHDAPMFTALGLSFSNVLPFFGTRGLFVGSGFFAELPDALVLLAASQAVFGILLLFFLGLGLRTRFRLR